MFETIRWREGKVEILDQSRLPLEVVYLSCREVGEVAEAIKTLKIRGAPAIGIAAAMGLALGAQSLSARDFREFQRGLRGIASQLAATRPTAVNLFWALDRMQAYAAAHREEAIEQIKQGLVGEAQRILEEDIAVNRAIGKWGAALIPDGARILTHCNAGALATGGYGTATAPMRVTVEEGKRIHVYADETRPVLQGARLTAWELMQDGIPVTLITDNMAAQFMRRGMIDLAIVGTDRTVRNGDVANKIGTYGVAVLCKAHKIPFYVAAPISSIDFSLATGKKIPIEERPPEEVTHIQGKRIAPEGVQVANPAFDVTPARLVTAIITEKGVFRPRDLRRLADPNADLETIRIREAPHTTR
ncbi:MAG: S-methyl-5-thioribose-1-phosphate isomerase [Nitrospirae bacterium]|nr:S-methyl-5-thioribose-1-phosphate isomerase [Nitrospirota bacterium]